MAYYGDLVTPTFSKITALDGDFSPFFHRSNLTDTSFTYSSITFSVDLDIRDPVGSDTALLTRIEWSSLAQRVEIVDVAVPEVSAAGSVAALGSVFALMLFLFERRSGVSGRRRSAA